MIKMEGVDVDRHPCASKQVLIVRFARREHGWGGAGDAAKEQQLVKGSEVGFDGGSHLSGER